MQDALGSSKSSLMSQQYFSDMNLQPSYDNNISSKQGHYIIVMQAEKFIKLKDI